MLTRFSESAIAVSEVGELPALTIQCPRRFWAALRRVQDQLQKESRSMGVLSECIAQVLSECAAMAHTQERRIYSEGGPSLNKGNACFAEETHNEWP